METLYAFPLEATGTAYTLTSIHSRDLSSTAFAAAGPDVFCLHFPSGEAAFTRLGIESKHEVVALSGCQSNLSDQPFELSIARASKSTTTISVAHVSNGAQLVHRTTQAAVLPVPVFQVLHTARDDPLAPCRVLLACGADGAVHVLDTAASPPPGSTPSPNAAAPGLHGAPSWVGVLETATAMPLHTGPMSLSLAFGPGGPAAPALAVALCTVSGHLRLLHWTPRAGLSGYPSPAMPETSAASDAAMPRHRPGTDAAPTAGTDPPTDTPVGRPAVPPQRSADLLPHPTAVAAACGELSRLHGGRAAAWGALLDGPLPACALFPRGGGVGGGGGSAGAVVVASAVGGAFAFSAAPGMGDDSDGAGGQSATAAGESAGPRPGAEEAPPLTPLGPDGGLLPGSADRDATTAVAVMQDGWAADGEPSVVVGGYTGAVVAYSRAESGAWEVVAEGDMGAPVLSLAAGKHTPAARAEGWSDLVGQSMRSLQVFAASK